MSLILKYWGVRGSLPSSPSPEQWAKDFEGLLQGFFKAGYSRAEQVKEYLATMSTPQIGGFGTATTSVQVKSAASQLIIDGGSGIRNIGDSMMKGPAAKGKANIHIFLTHFHWDHVLGLPFFAPLFIAGNKVNVYAVQPELEEMVRGVFKRPYFPVAFESLASEIKFHRLEPRQTAKLDDMNITSYQLDHPDPCWGLRVESGGRVYAHCVDTEGTRSTREALGPDLPLYQGVDMMYFDAQYTFPELAEKANWGHSASQIGLDIAFRENIRHLVFAHHDPGATTQDVYELKRQTKEYYDWRMKTAETNRVSLPQVRWRFAFEGLELDLSKL
ncbi:MAG: MBL fold metallo-hydrolase [Bdellovibrio sp.]|jgi:phosphoribosyl 1,2-cyclic phosphodiesterase